MASTRELTELRGALRVVLRGLRRRRQARLDVNARLGPRHLAILALVASEGERTVGEIAQELGLSLPAASKLSRDLEKVSLVHRREHIDDRRRTVVDVNGLTVKQVQAWANERNRPLEAALDALTATERTAFLKGLRALAQALMEESEHGSVGPHHRSPYRRRPHRHRPV